MDLNAPFTGTLYMPDKEFLAAGSPVLLTSGEILATIRWHVWSQEFEVLDSKGAIVAECVPTGVFRKRYTVRLRNGRRILELRPGVWRPFAGAEVTLGSGRALTMHKVSVWSDRKFEFTAPEGLVGRIMPTTGAFSFRPDSYAFELLLPVMSALEAISLAQAVRLAVRGIRQASSSTATSS
jgi:hypothetical protein